MENEIDIQRVPGKPYYSAYRNGVFLGYFDSFMDAVFSIVHDGSEEKVNEDAE